MRLQGTAVPVYLGNINLTEWYYFDLGVRIVHMLLMSWAGEIAADGDVVDLKEEVRQSVREVRREGVVHGDVCCSNVFWSAERERAMLVDFERSVVADDGAEAL